MPDKNLLYKYVPFSIDSLKILINGELWLGYPENMNDPFEGEFIIQKNECLPRKILIEAFYERNEKFLNGQSFDTKYKEIFYDKTVFHKDLQSELKIRLKKHYGVTCFSTNEKNILMWSHYAESHRGFIIAFEKDKLLSSLKYPFQKVGNVNYQSNLTTADIIIEKNRIEYKNELEILNTKLRHWKNEKEFRIIAYFTMSNKTRNILFDKSSIHTIIFGSEMNEIDQKTIENLLSQIPDYSNVKKMKAEKDLENKKMKIRLATHGIRHESTFSIKHFLP